MTSANDRPQERPDAQGRRGLAVRAACRVALREALPAAGSALPEAGRPGLAELPVEIREHIEACPECQGHLRAARSLAGALVQRPVAPIELGSPSLLAAVHERCVDAAESGPLGAWIVAGAVRAPEQEAGPDWSDAVLADPRRASLADSLLQPPQSPELEVWGRMRRSILAEFATGARRRAIRIRPKTALGLALASIAATLVLSLFSYGLRQPVTPTITFTDLDRAPDIDFAAVRYGLRR